MAKIFPEFAVVREECTWKGAEGDGKRTSAMS